MSRVDLDPITLEQLAHGSRMSACCDEAELRANHDTLSARVQRQVESEPLHWGWVIAAILALCAIVFSAGHYGPIGFNPFNR